MDSPTLRDASWVNITPGRSPEGEFLVSHRETMKLLIFVRFHDRYPRICHMPDGLQPFLFAYVTAIRPFLFLATARIRAVLRAVLRILGGKRIRRSRRNHLSHKPPNRACGNKKALNEARWSPTDRKVRQTDTRSTKRGTGRALTWRALARAALAPKVLTPQITQAVRGIRPACRRSGHLPPSSWPIGQRAGEPSERAKRLGQQESLVCSPRRGC